MSGVEWTAVTLMTVRNGNLWMRGNVEQGRLNYYAVWTRTDVKEMDMALLLREAIGDTLRSARSGQGKTLREVSDSARVSLGYLSEVERGRKEASSELLAAICGALDVPLSQVLSEVSETGAARGSCCRLGGGAGADGRVTQRDRRGHQGRHSAGSRNGGRLTTVAVALFRVR